MIVFSFEEDSIGGPLKETLQRLEPDGHQKRGEEHSKCRFGMISISQCVLRKENHEDINGKGDHEKHRIDEGSLQDNFDVHQPIANNRIGDEAAHDNGQNLTEPVEGKNSQRREDQIGNHPQVCRDKGAEEDIADLHPADSGGVEVLLAEDHERPAEIRNDEDEVDGVGRAEDDLLFAGGIQHVLNHHARPEG